MKGVDILFLSQEEIMNLNISWDLVFERTEMALKEHGAKTVENPPKPGVHSKDNSFIHAMPAYLEQMNVIGIKWVSGYPDNYKHDLPSILGLQIMNCPETGVPLAIMDCAWITAVRTAAVTGITAKYCARKNSKTISIIGAGVQGKMNLTAVKKVLPGLKHCKIYDIKENMAKTFKEEMELKEDIKITIVNSPEEVVRDSDIVITATQKLPEPIVETEWLKKGVFAAGLEGSRAWTDKAIFGADKFITDDLEQVRLYHSHGGFPGGIPELYAETGEIVLGLIPGRETENENILAFNMGLACEDMSLGQYIYEQALERKIGTKISLIKEDLC